MVLEPYGLAWAVLRRKTFTPLRDIELSASAADPFYQEHRAGGPNGASVGLSA